MKKLFTILAVAAAVVACQKNETIALDNGEAIAFGNAFVENSVRAADPSYGTTDKPLTAFKVWGTVTGSEGPVAIFADDLVSGTVGVDNTWNCTTKTQYWITGATYEFAAVVDGNVTTENGLPKTISYTADGTTTDLLYARAKRYTGLADNNPKVAFEFKHLLSKVKFTLENTTSNADNVGVYTYTLTDVKITNAITNGTYTVADIFNLDTKVYTVAGSWTTNEAKGMTFENIEGVTNATSKESASEKLVIPMADATVSCNVNIYYGGKLITTTPASKTVKLEPGNAYNFKVSTGLNNTIMFTVETQPSWAGPTGVDVPLQ